MLLSRHYATGFGVFLVNMLVVMERNRGGVQFSNSF